MEGKVLILDFGSQYTQLIARRVREAGVYCEIHPYHFHIKNLRDWQAIILSGSPFSVKDKNALKFDLDHIFGRIPILGICYGAQYIALSQGGSVERSRKREYGKAHLDIIERDELFDGIENGSKVWMSHGDSILSLPGGFKILASTESIPIAAYRTELSDQVPTYCLQFHPEVTHTTDGFKLLMNFLFKIVRLKPTWTPASFVAESVANIKSQVGKDRVMMAISGGVDSTVAAYLIKKAIGDQLTCFFVDNGLLRKNEFEEVLETYKNSGLNVVGIDAKRRFWDALAGIEDPERKRKIIGREFIKIFEEEATKLSNIKWLGQGTIYPDVIESLSVHGPSATIKSHHNVGGLPETFNLSLVEPLRSLFKDEVRRVGKEIGVPDYILSRHPFPGPGLSIRILGAISEERVKLLQEADAIFINGLKKWDLYDKVWQAGVMLLDSLSVGVMGDERTYESVVALRAVRSLDGMTAEWCDFPHEFLATVSNEIINTVKGINRVVYDISTKPPATIEWE